MFSELTPQSTSVMEAPAYWLLNGLYTVIATTESTGGAYSLVHLAAPPGHGTPYHVHRNEDEAFYVLEGEFTVICNGKKSVAGPGGYIFLPRNLPHGFRCSASVPSAMLTLAMPGSGFVGMITEMEEPAKDRRLPLPAAPDFEKLARTCAKHQIDILGPLPE
jgi:quercetin dioxygenase-like cupin family protein